jgi:hypothetical protein
LVAAGNGTVPAGEILNGFPTIFNALLWVTAASFVAAYLFRCLRAVRMFNFF